MSKILYSLIAIAFLLLSWRISYISNALEKEELAHKHTIQELTNWKAIANKAKSDAKNIQSLANAALLREEKARVQFVERTELLKNTKSIERTKKTLDKGGIIDDEARKKVANRINRDL